MIAYINDFQQQKETLIFKTENLTIPSEVARLQIFFRCGRIHIHVHLGYDLHSGDQPCE